MPLLCGGTTEAKDANEEVQKICDQVGHFKIVDTLTGCETMCHKPLFLQIKSHAEGKAGRKFDVFIAKSYKTQLVAGTNYFIKVIICGTKLCL